MPDQVRHDTATRYDAGFFISPRSIRNPAYILYYLIFCHSRNFISFLLRSSRGAGRGTRGQDSP